MKEFRLKQKKLKKIMNIFCIITAVFMFVYIGVEPFLPDIIGSVGTLCVGYAADVLVVVSVALLFVYSFANTTLSYHSDYFLACI